MSNSPIKEVIYHSEEDKIIESLILEGLRRSYDDSDFLPIRQSLYNIENVIPMYDDEISASITWCRPQGISDYPVYFNTTNRIAVIQGNLPDEVFIGALMAVCTYPKYDLMENIFSSRPDDFKRHGIFTCRFYVEGDWVEVITDTNIPCLKDDLTNLYTPVYSRSIDIDEMWICLVEKAYAKAVGSYEAIPRVRIQEALMHMTGGSVQQIHINDDPLFKTGNKLWEMLKEHLDSFVMILTSPTPLNLDDSPSAQESNYLSYEDLQNLTEENITHLKQPNQFQLNHFYSVILAREYAKVKLILLHNPWSKGIDCWFGNYSNINKKFWLDNENLLDKIKGDSTIPWSLDEPNGYFWMEYTDFQIYFNNTFLCKLFPTNFYKFYCIKGEWREKQAGGQLIPIRDKNSAITAYNDSKKFAFDNASAVTIVDGDSSWFNNPQIRIYCNKATKLFVSTLPLSGDKDGGGLALGVDVIEVNKAVDGSRVNQLHIWDGTLANIIASDKVDSSGRAKGQEASIWSLDISAHHYYNIIPHTMKRGQEGFYLLRVFALDSIVVEQMPSLYINTLHGDWHRSHDTDTTGGPLRLTYENGKQRENSKWCQNPQFHLELQDLYSPEEVKIKVVVRRTDKAALVNHRTNQPNTTVSGTTPGPSGATAGANAIETKSTETMVGLTISLAKSLEDNVAKNKKKKQPRLTAVGELIPQKVSTLKKSSNQLAGESKDDDYIAPTRKEKYDITKILRQYSLLDEIHVFESSYSSRTEACIYFPKISRSLIPQGFIVTPSLNEKGVKAVASKVYVRITLSRYGLKWKMMTKKDPIGSMIGFYIFIHRHNSNEIQQVYESPFVPTDELCTDSSFTLEILQSGDEYIIIPTTFNEGKFGSFVMTIMTETDFRFHKEK
eukprot:gene20461-26549_t